MSVRAMFIHHYHTDTGILYCNIMSVHGKAHGMIQLDSENCYISSVSVSDDSRNKGWGTLVMDELERNAVAHGIGYTTLAVRQGSTTQDWYSRRGYKEISTEMMDGVLLTWMRKELQTENQ